MEDFSRLSDQHLDELILSLSLERDEVKRQARAVTAERDRRVAMKVVNDLTDDQKAHIVGVLGIESKEGVNGG